jgi:RNA polymerase sigma-70 factor, ECF subfamily
VGPDEPAAKSGFAPALAAPERALEEVSSSVYRVLRRLGVPADDIDDAVQSVLVQLLRHWDRLGALPFNELRAYACTVASGTAVDFARRRKLTNNLLVPLEEEPVLPKVGADDAFDQKRALEVLDEVLAKIPEERRVVFVLFELEEVSLQEIAERLSVPLGTVSSRLRKAREEFARIVERMKKSGTLLEGGR